MALIDISSGYQWERNEPYSRQDFFGIIDSVVDKYFYGFYHPLGEKLLNGEFNKDELQFLAMQEYAYYAGTTWWNACKLAQSDALMQQRLLHGPLLDELGTDLVNPKTGLPAHSELFMQYCEALGLTKQQVLSAPLVPSVIVAISELRRIMRDRPVFEALACSNLVVERMRPIHYAKLLRVFETKYTWISESGLLFYKLHAQLDGDHESLGRKIIGQYIYCKQNQDCIFSSILRSICLRLCMYDGIYQALNNSNAAGVIAWPNFPKEPWPRPLLATQE